MILPILYEQNINWFFFLYKQSTTEKAHLSYDQPFNIVSCKLYVFDKLKKNQLIRIIHETSYAVWFLITKKNWCKRIIHSGNRTTQVALYVVDKNHKLKHYLIREPVFLGLAQSQFYFCQYIVRTAVQCRFCICGLPLASIRLIEHFLLSPSTYFTMEKYTSGDKCDVVTLASNSNKVRALNRDSFSPIMTALVPQSGPRCQRKCVLEEDDLTFLSHQCISLAVTFIFCFL